MAISRGMRTLREAGLDLVAAGRTTVEEVLRETQL
jgi:type II secretory ATPase GspE/PulE/Tfp pilus assembly ATPase PilB-like protein